jgi:hypothetical protein
MNEWLFFFSFFRIYNELGTKLGADYDGIVIAKMDATANDASHSKYSA